MTDTPNFAETYTDLDADEGFFSHLSWGAVFGGLAVAIAVQVVLALIGIAVGMAAAAPGYVNGPHHAGAIGIGEGLWYLVSTLVSIFTGAAVAARLAGAVLRDDGVLHGLVTWAISLIVALFLLSSAVGGLAGGALHSVGWAHRDGGRMAREQGPDMGPGAGPAGDDMIASNPSSLTPDQARGDLHMQMGRLAANPSDSAAHDRAVADLESQGVSPADANNRVENGLKRIQQAEKDAADAIALGATWAALSLILGAGAAGFGGSCGARWAAESAGLDLYPSTKK